MLSQENIGTTDKILSNLWKRSSWFCQLIYICAVQLKENDEIGSFDSFFVITIHEKCLHSFFIIALVINCLFAVIYMFLVAQGKLDHYTDKEKEIMLAYIAAPCFANSVMNPILYSFQIPEVKKAFLKTFCCFKKKTTQLEKMTNTLTISNY